MKIGIASDHAGFQLKQLLVSFLQEKGYDVIDYGPENNTDVDYVDYAKYVTDAIHLQTIQRGILICGTGVGMCISANKVRGIRCALATDVYTAKAARAHNDTNVLALGGRVLGTEIAKMIVEVWLKGEFEAGRHAQRVAKIKELEERGE